MFSRMKVSVRLATLAGSMIALLVLIGVLGISGMHSSNQAMASVYNDRVVPLKQLKTISDNYAVAVIDNVNKANAGLISAEEALQLWLREHAPATAAVFATPAQRHAVRTVVVVGDKSEQIEAAS